jgi:hypothetical protein
VLAAALGSVAGVFVLATGYMIISGLSLGSAKVGIVKTAAISSSQSFSAPRIAAP